MRKTITKTAILFTTLAVLAVIIAVVCFSFFKESATAAVMRLISATGEVSLTNEESQPLDIEENMRLFSGNSIKTGQESYAFINLDDTKAVKLDEASLCTLKKEDKELEVIMLEGEMFFNVSAPLEDDELFNIRTSTMVTSIRGTSGYVNYESENVTYFTLFTGKVDIFGLDNVAGVKTATTLKPGETAKVEFDGEKTTVEVTQTNPNNLPSFVVDEFIKDSDLANESLEQSGIDFNNLEIDDDDDNDDDDNDSDDDTDEEDDSSESDDDDIDDDNDDNIDNDDDNEDSDTDEEDESDEIDDDINEQNDTDDIDKNDDIYDNNTDDSGDRVDTDDNDDSTDYDDVPAPPPSVVSPSDDDDDNQGDEDEDDGDEDD